MPGFFFYLTAGAIYDNMISLFIPAFAPSNTQAQRCRQIYSKIRCIRLDGFGWSSQKRNAYVRSVETPCHVVWQTACRCLEEQGPLANLAKADLSCFYKRGSSNTLHLGSLAV